MTNHRCLSLVVVCMVQLLFPLSSRQTTGGESKTTSEANDVLLTLSETLVFENKEVQGRIHQSDVERLLDLNVRNGDSNPRSMYGVQLTTHDDKVVDILTCRQWKSETGNGSYPSSTYDIAMNGYFIHTCGLMYSLLEAKSTRKSYVSNPRVGLSNIDLLPSNMLPSYSSNKQHIRGLTIGAFVTKGKVQIKKRTKNELHLVYDEDLKGFYTEEARADFDGDGVEDIFVWFDQAAIGGSMTASDNLILTRHNTSAVFSVTCGWLC